MKKKQLVGYVAGDMRKHRIHPRWSRLTLCDKILEETGWSFREQAVTCAGCLKVMGLGLLPERRRSRLPEPKLGEHLDIWLRCECGHHQLRALPADEPIRVVLRSLACGKCGDAGRCHLGVPQDSLAPHAQ